MKRTLFCTGVILLTILILLVGKICLAESGQPTATIYGWNGTEWIKLNADVNGYLKIVISSVTGNITINDSRYEGKVSTGTAGLINASGNISITNYEMEAYTFYSDGGDTTITGTWFDGTMYAVEGIPIGPEKLSIPITNPTFQCTLPAGTSLYYILHGVQ